MWENCITLPTLKQIYPLLCLWCLCINQTPPNFDNCSWCYQEIRHKLHHYQSHPAGSCYEKWHERHRNYSLVLFFFSFFRMDQNSATEPERNTFCHPLNSRFISPFYSFISQLLNIYRVPTICYISCVASLCYLPLPKISFPCSSFLGKSLLIL